MIFIFFCFIQFCVCGGVLSSSVMSDSLRPHELQPTRLLPSVEFSRKECWGGLSSPFPGDLPNSGVKHRSPALQTDSLPSEPPGTQFSRYDNLLGPSMLLQMALLHSFQWLGIIPLHICTTSSLSICQWTFKLVPCLGYYKQCQRNHNSKRYTHPKVHYSTIFLHIFLHTSLLSNINLYTIIYVYHSLFVHSSTEGYLNCFQVWTVMKKTTTINYGVQVFVWTYICNNFG